MSSLLSIPAAPRPNLMKLLDSLHTRRFIYIYAPAGYGKTYSIRMWLKTTASASAWVPISESAGQNPAEFCEWFMRAMSSLQPDNPGFTVLNKLISKRHRAFISAPIDFVNQAMNSFQTSRLDDGRAAGYYLVLDDLHWITDSNLLTRLPEMICRLPENVTILFISRAEPPDSFSGLVVKDMLALVNVEHLKFSKREITSFFAACDRKLTEQQAEEIRTITGGWAIGVTSILLSGDQANEKKLFFRHLDTFIREQVWRKWDQRRQGFMLRLSIVDEFTPDLCTALTGEDSSADILNSLVRENAFLDVVGDGTYRFHNLFLGFLRNMLEQGSGELKNDVAQNAGDWYYDNADYCRAVEQYTRCDNKEGIVKCLKRLYDYNSPCTAIEDALSVIRLSLDSSIVEEYPFLLEVQAWAAFVNGDVNALVETIDQYYEKIYKIILQNPKSAQIAMLVRLMDPRVSMIQYMREIKTISLKKEIIHKAFTPSVTQNMPLFHRSIRDFSEYLPNLEENFSLLHKSFGILFDETEYKIIENCLRAGLAYECGNLNLAHEAALTANALLKDSIASEITFCALMILIYVLEAQGQRADVKKILDGVASMIERDKAYYLNANRSAFLYRLRLTDCDEEAAKDWLRHYAESPFDKPTFYKLYHNFTTARAYIVIEDYNTAILFIKKLLALCESYRRPLDIMEGNILLAIAYWKKGRGEQNKAFAPLEQAILLAQEYEFTQIFANEGAALINMLHKLQRRLAQKDCNSEIKGAFVKTLYILTLERSKYYSGLTGSRNPKNLKFTGQQKNVMRLLCEGLTQREIAVRMGLKPSAIKSHMILIYKKLDVTNGVSAIVKIKELGLLDK